MNLEWREVTFTVTEEELRQSAAYLHRPYRVRCGRLYHWIHRKAGRGHTGFFGWIMRTRLYRWWGQQTYGPSLAEEGAKAIADAVDRDIARLFMEQHP